MRYLKILYRFFLLQNSLIRSQRKTPLSIPIIIINFNQLFYLKKQVDFYLSRGFENIIIIDNYSTFPPLIEYYKEIRDLVKIEFMEQNFGHLVFFKNKNLQKKYGKGYFVITDPDIVPNKNLPLDFLKIIIEKLHQYFDTVNKVGFALEIDNIPNYFPYKEEVLIWENKHWENEIEKECYMTQIDTTFALYKPNYPSRFSGVNFYNGLRLAGDFTAIHGGWYKNPNQLTEEEKFYEEHASSSASWTKIKSDEQISDRYSLL